MLYEETVRYQSIVIKVLIIQKQVMKQKDIHIRGLMIKFHMRQGSVIMYSEH